MASCKHNLPPQPTSFVGRETEIAEIISLLSNQYCRLVTLVGPGGVGKTRMALKVADALVQTSVVQESFPYADGIFFVPLQSVSSAAQIVPTILGALDWVYDEGKNPKAALVDYLRDKRLLLILDNVEHLVAAAPLLQELLHGAPQIKLLVTSRVVLNLAEEWLFHVAGMSLLPIEGDNRIGSADAVELFRQRAQRVRHDFSLIEEQSDVVRICQFVEGMPLAIELAAAWLRHLSCAEIAAEIQHSLEILQSDQLGIPDRHRTMRAVFDHSWRLLSQAERDLCKELSVFHGGFLRPAAEEIAGATISLLSALVDKSLLRVSVTGRYAIHELQRQYGAERLAASPAQEQAVRDRHSAYYLRLIAQPVQSYLGDSNKQLVEAIEAESSNIFAAWYWAVDQRRIADLHMATEGLYWFAWLSTYHEECEKALRYAVDMLHSAQPSDEQRITYAHALAMHGIMNIWLGHNQKANEELLESVALLRNLPDAQRELANAVGGLGWSAYAGAEIEKAKALLHEAIELDQATKQFELQAWIYSLLGDVAKQQGAYEECKQWSQRALAFGRTIGDQRTIAHALCELGWLATNQGDYGAARGYLEESLLTARSHKLTAFWGMALAGLGQLALMTGDLETASSYLEQRLEVARFYGKQPKSVANSLSILAQVRSAQGDYTLAASLCQQAAALLAETHQERPIELLLSMGKLKLYIENFAGAQLMYEECLTLSRQSGDRPGIAQSHLGLGLAALGQDDGVNASCHLLEALREGLAIGFAPILLDSIAAVAEFLATDGDLAYAAQLAALAKDHTAGTAETQRRAHKVLMQAMQEPSAKTFALTTARTASSKLEAVAKKLVAELSRPAGVTAQPVVPYAAALLSEPLSERERQVLRLVAAGKSNRQIGSELYLALGTVKAHLNHIFQKLDVQNRAQAVVQAMDLNLL
ncbi:MAG: tetratricopeptide repeat protein [Caldilineaceae bacterium]